MQDRDQSTDEENTTFMKKTRAHRKHRPANTDNLSHKNGVPNDFGCRCDNTDGVESGWSRSHKYVNPASTSDHFLAAILANLPWSAELDSRTPDSAENKHLKCESDTRRAGEPGP